MKALLINPPYSYVYGLRKPICSYVPPLGLAYVAAMLETSSDIDVEILDMDPCGLGFNPWNLEKDVRDKIEKELVKRQADVIGISVSSSTFKASSVISKLIKKVSRETVVVAGGPHATVFPEHLLRSSDLDIVVLGEGEETVLELFRAIQRHDDLADVKGLAYKNNKSIVRTKQRPLIENLDNLPFPARHLLPMNKYRLSLRRDFRTSHKAVFTTMISSRGCPFRCIYCGSHTIFGHKYRVRSPENVVDEMEEVGKRFSVRFISFYDDLFVGVSKRGKERFLRICDEILARKLDVMWEFDSRVDLIDEEILRRAKKAGCVAVNFGVESGSYEILKKLGKNVTLNQIEKAFKACKRTNVSSSASLIIGSPGETPQDVEKTIRFAKKLSPDYVHFHLMTIIPGTEIYDIAKEEGLIENNWWVNGSINPNKRVPIGNQPTYVPREMTLEGMVKLRSEAYRSFYYRPKYLLQQLGNLKSLHDAKRLIRGMKIWWRI